MAPDPEERRRYDRQMLLPGIGPQGQARLETAHALVIGVGALGTVAAEALCRAGVGRLTLVDRDVVEWTNLQRQTLYEETDARDGTPKALAAAARLNRVNRRVRVDALVRDFTPTVARYLITAKPGVILDCTDNFETRYLVNDVSVWAGVPYVYAGAVGTVGMVRAVVPAGGVGVVTPCLRCVFDRPPPAGTAPTCDTAGVLGPAAGAAALLQAGEAMKILLGRNDLLRRGLVTMDLWSAGSDAVRVIDVGERDAACPCCAGRVFEWLEARAGAIAVRLCGRNAVQIASLGACFIDEDDDAEAWEAEGRAGPADLARIGARLRAHGDVLEGPSLVRCTLAHDRAEDGTAVEITVFADGRTVVKGTQDAARARSLVARYVGA
ncbi:MAG: ThiF family adenylyltransferase [Phycisphaerales bacterium]